MLIPLNHLEFEHPKDSNPQVSFYPGQCQCSLSPQMCHDEEKGSLSKEGQRHIHYILIKHPLQIKKFICLFWKNMYF